jgi:Flp pilus assembly protein TadB
MDDTNAPAPRSDSETLSPVEQVQALVGDVKALAEAELAYAKSRLAYSGGVIRKAGLWALLALLFLSGAVVALILGLLLILTVYVGPWLATAIVVLLFLLAAWAAGSCARSTANDLKFEEDGNDG